jgi:transcriptional regulator with XRE-family HTH domain
MSDLAKRLGRRIYEFRKRSGLTQAVLAEKSKLSNEFISSVERGAKLPSISTLDRIAGALRIEIKDLFNFDRSSFRKIDPLSRQSMDYCLNIRQSTEQASSTGNPYLEHSC